MPLSDLLAFAAGRSSAYSPVFDGWVLSRMQTLKRLSGITGRIPVHLVWNLANPSLGPVTSSFTIRLNTIFCGDKSIGPFRVSACLIWMNKSVRSV